MGGRAVSAERARCGGGSKEGSGGNGEGRVDKESVDSGGGGEERR